MAADTISVGGQTPVEYVRLQRHQNQDGGRGLYDGPQDTGISTGPMVPFLCQMMEVFYEMMGPEM